MESRAKLFRTFRKVVASILPWKIQRFAYRRLAKRYIDRILIPPDPSLRTILLINHFFNQDLKAILYANQGRYRIQVVDAPALFRGAKIFFERDVIALRASYETTPKSMRQEYALECKWIMDQIEKEQSIDLLVATSDTFYWIRELIVVAQSRGIRAVVVDKEGTISPYAYDAVVKWIVDFAPFMSDHIYVWSERQKEFWEKTGVEESRITVVGQPRSDLFYIEHENTVDQYFKTSQPLVTYFIFDDKAYIPREMLDKGMNWSRLKAETMSDLTALASEFFNINFVVKSHPQQSDLEELQKTYGIDNLVVLGGSEISNELILRSEMIIGFQTTALIEAMFLNKRVIYTAWDEDYKSHLRPELLPIHEAPGIVVAETREQFRNVVRQVLAGNFSSFEFDEPTLEARRSFVNEYFYKPDGHVCERLFAEFDRLLNAAPVQ